MNILYITLLYFASAYCEQNHSKIALDHKNAQYKITTDLPLHPVAPLAVQRTGNHSVRTTREIHHNVYKFVKSASQANSQKKENEKYKIVLTANKTNVSAKDLIKPSVQNYKDVTIKLNNHGEASKILQYQIDQQPNHDIKNDYQRTTSIHNNQISTIDKKDVGLLDATTHQQRAAEHLKALRNVLALQLQNYKGDLPRTEVPAQKVELDSNKRVMTKGTNQSKKRHVTYDSFDRDMKKKLDVIAAAKALMKLLDA